MARSDESDPYLGLNGEDPYLTLNGKKADDGGRILAEKKKRAAPVLADDSDKPRSKAKEEKKDQAFEPSLIRGLMSVLKGLDKRLDEQSKPAKPIVNVEVPKAPAPEVHIEAPTHWKAKVKRDSEGLIQEVDFIAVK